MALSVDMDIEVIVAALRAEPFPEPPPGLRERVVEAMVDGAAAPTLALAGANDRWIDGFPPRAVRPKVRPRPGQDERPARHRRPSTYVAAAAILGVGGLAAGLATRSGSVDPLASARTGRDRPASSTSVVTADPAPTSTTPTTEPPSSGPGSGSGTGSDGDVVGEGGLPIDNGDTAGTGDRPTTFMPSGGSTGSPSVGSTPPEGTVVSASEPPPTATTATTQPATVVSSIPSAPAAAVSVVLVEPDPDLGCGPSGRKLTAVLTSNVALARAWAEVTVSGGRTAQVELVGHGLRWHAELDVPPGRPVEVRGFGTTADARTLAAPVVGSTAEPCGDRPWSWPLDPDGSLVDGLDPAGPSTEGGGTSPAELPYPR